MLPLNRTIDYQTGRPLDRQFWHHRWESNRIGFHNHTVNPALEAHVDALSLVEGNRVFLPLCGKTLDISWLLAHGIRVAGVELSELAVQQLFSELGVDPVTSTNGLLKHYQAHNVDIFVGDIFDLNAGIAGTIDAIYDRAALVALPVDMRHRYTAHLVEVTQAAPQLLVTFTYDQMLMEGPPFSVDMGEVHTHYKGKYALKLLADTEVPGGLKGVCPAQEQVWHLRRPSSVHATMSV